MVTVFKNFNLIDGTKNCKLKTNQMIEITDSKITNLGTFKVKEGSKVIDLNGKYLLPGLINMHAHLPASGKVNPNKKAADNKKLVKLICSNKLTRQIGILLSKKYAKMELFSGVTTVRTVGGVSNFDSIVRDKINKGKILGPRILTSNYAIGTPGGHMVGTVAVGASSVEEALNLVDDLAQSKVDLIKLMITGGVLDSEEIGKPARLRMQPEMVKAVCDKAHKLGFKVAAHVESGEGIKVAIENGVDSIEHGADLDENLIELLKQRHGSICCTLSPAIPFVKLDPKETGYGEVGKENGTVVFNGIVECAKKCLEAGINVGLGNDCGSPFVTHYNFYKELDYFVRFCDVSKEFAIYSATLCNAKIAGIDNITGSIEIGKDADILIVDCNPLDDLNNLSNPRIVITRGKIIHNPKNKKYPSVEASLNKLN